MNLNLKNTVIAASTLVIGSFIFSSCQSPSTEGMTTSADDATKKMAEVVKKTPKDNLRGKQETKVYDGPITTFTVNEEVHDFGLVEQGSSNTFTFIVTNTGDAPLVVEDAKSTCGCTVPKKPTEPIAPGETGEIEVTFKPKKGQTNVTKPVNITANTEPRLTSLKIKATVRQDETTETPAN